MCPRVTIWSSFVMSTFLKYSYQNFRYKKGGYSYHEGGPSDERMAAAAAKRGIDLTSLSRPLRPDDLVRFEYILAMDFDNKAAIELATDHWADEGFPIPSGYRDKVRFELEGLLL